MRLYWEVFLRGYRRYATYRAATAAGVFANTAFAFLRAAVLIALFESRATVGGYDLSDALTFVFVGQAMLMSVYLWGWWDIALAIRSGNIVTDLTRPFDFQAYWLSMDLGRAVYHAVFRGIPPFIIGALVFDLRWPGDAVTWLAFLLAVVLAVCVSFAMRFMLNLAAFWLLDYRGVGALVTGLWTVLSGFAIPIAFFPGALKTVAQALPFAAVVQVPIDVFLGKYGGLDLAGILAFQLAWAIGLLALGRLMLRAATKRVVTQGG